MLKISNFCHLFSFFPLDLSACCNCAKINAHSKLAVYFLEV
ncbi:hypothetical protein NXF25_000309 [Crotalus adamanteus]|uniref:Uncharacterized protein n=2 Tax=Colubroidea TaxID=34989 RepID=V8N9Y5_OPHHA|nr:hypothetical protein L345_15366 [Ophiophagus hannah]